MDNFEDKAAKAEKMKGIILASKIDPAAFYPLYLEYVDNVYYYVLSRIRSHQDAEDITAEVFTRAINHLNRYREEGNFLAWLLTIARNLTFDHYRNRDNHWLELSELPLPNEEFEFEVEDKLLLKSKLKQLTPEQLEILVLRYNARLTFLEISKFLGKKEDAVRKAHNKIIGSLRSQMEVLDD